MGHMTLSYTFVMEEVGKVLFVSVDPLASTGRYM